MNTLVLAPSFSPLDEIPVRRAVRLVLEEKAQILKAHPTRIFRNADGRVRIPAPLVIVLEALEDFKGAMFGPATFSRGAVFLRDDHTCQYCGRHRNELVRGATPREVELRYGKTVVRMWVSREFLNIDHITPQRLGGEDSFLNCVVACDTCNGRRKGGKTLRESGMFLRRKPRTPTRAEIFLARLGADVRELVAEIFTQPTV